MKYSLRSLIISVLVLPPLLASAWFAWMNFRKEVPEEMTYPITAPLEADDELANNATAWREVSQHMRP